MLRGREHARLSQQQRKGISSILDLEDLDEQAEHDDEHDEPEVGCDALLVGALDGRDELCECNDRKGEERIHACDRLRLEDILVAETTGKDGPWLSVRWVSDSVPHVTADKSNDGSQAACGPHSAALKQRPQNWIRDEDRDGDERDAGRDEDVGPRVEGLVELELMRGQRVEPVVELVRVEAATGRAQGKHCQREAPETSL